MSENSPYDAPESDVAVSSGTSKLSLKEIYFSFKGRIPRKVFWIHGMLGMIGASIVIGIVIGGLAALIGGAAMILLIPFYIALVWAGLAISIKRWHDRNKSGWWVLIGLVPIIGLWAIIETGFLETIPGDNEYGPEPGEY